MTKLEVKKVDITTLNVDCIVNTANSTLLGGGGVDGAIHREAGLELLEECKTLGGCKVGEAKITKGYNLSSKYIIHTVGPFYSSQEESEELLSDCYYNSLEVARKNNIKSIAFPCISIGVFKYPKDEAAKVAINTIKRYIKEYPDVFKKIIFAVFEELDLNIYNKLI